MTGKTKTGVIIAGSTVGGLALIAITGTLFVAAVLLNDIISGERKAD